MFFFFQNDNKDNFYERIRIWLGLYCTWYSWHWGCRQWPASSDLTLAGEQLHLQNCDFYQFNVCIGLVEVGGLQFKQRKMTSASTKWCILNPWHLLKIPRIHFGCLMYYLTISAINVFLWKPPTLLHLKTLFCAFAFSWFPLSLSIDAADSAISSSYQLSAWGNCKCNWIPDSALTCNTF